MDEHTLQAELAAIEAKPSAGCRWGMAPTCASGDPDVLVIDVVGVPDAGMAGMNVLWVVA